jgi:hypothetical protein
MRDENCIEDVPCVGETRDDAPENLREKEFWTAKDVMRYYGIGRMRAARIVQALQAQVTDEGKIPLDGRVSSKRVLRSVG